METQTKQKGKLVPKLRFKGFDGDWEQSKIGDDCKVLMCKRIFAEQTNVSEEIPFYKIGTIGGKPDVFISRTLFEEFSNKYNYPKKGEILITCSGTVGKCIPFDGRDSYYQDSNIVWIDNPSLRIRNEYLFYILSNFDWGKLNSTTISRIYGSDLRNLVVKHPTLPEQQKISSFLSSVDEKLSQLTRKKERLALYKKGVMQQLFSGSLRFKDENGKDFPKWQERKLSDVLFEHKQKSTGREEVFSVSVHKGLVNQVEHLGRVFAAKNTDNYNLVKPNDIVYTKSPTGDFPLGIIKQSKLDKQVIISPLYGVFTPETPGIGYLLHVYFESPINVTNYLASIIQKGAKNTINITNTIFLSKPMKLPVSKEEQEKIGAFLSSIDDKISAITAQISQTQSFKKGLLQQMFV